MQNELTMFTIFTLLMCLFVIAVALMLISIKRDIIAVQNKQIEVETLLTTSLLDLTNEVKKINNGVVISTKSVLK